MTAALLAYFRAVHDWHGYIKFLGLPDADRNEPRRAVAEFVCRAALCGAASDAGEFR